VTSSIPKSLGMINTGTTKYTYVQNMNEPPKTLKKNGPLLPMASRTMASSTQNQKLKKLGDSLLTCKILVLYQFRFRS